TLCLELIFALEGESSSLGTSDMDADEDFDRSSHHEDEDTDAIDSDRSVDSDVAVVNRAQARPRRHAAKAKRVPPHKVMPARSSRSATKALLLSFLNARNAAGDTALHIAARSGFLPLVQVLVQTGADKYIRNAYGREAASEATDRSVSAFLQSDGTGFDNIMTSDAYPAIRIIAGREEASRRTRHALSSDLQEVRRSRHRLSQIHSQSIDIRRRLGSNKSSRHASGSSASPARPPLAASAETDERHPDSEASKVQTEEYSGSSTDQPSSAVDTAVQVPAVGSDGPPRTTGSPPPSSPITADAATAATPGGEARDGSPLLPDLPTPTTTPTFHAASGRRVGADADVDSALANAADRVSRQSAKRICAEIDGVMELRRDKDRGYKRLMASAYGVPVETVEDVMNG
ncbi:hypothetical protein HK405_006496, partial [Cladochytrium tenue]